MPGLAVCGGPDSLTGTPARRSDDFSGNKKRRAVARAALVVVRLSVTHLNAAMVALVSTSTRWL